MHDGFHWLQQQKRYEKWKNDFGFESQNGSYVLDGDIVYIHVYILHKISWQEDYSTC